MFDFDSLTLGEVAFIEDLSGMSIAAIGDMEKPKGKAFAALVTVAKRRNGFPNFKFNDALDIPMNEANELLGFITPETDDEGEAEDSEQTEIE